MVPRVQGVERGSRTRGVVQVQVGWRTARSEEERGGEPRARGIARHGPSSSFLLYHHRRLYQQQQNLGRPVRLDLDLDADQIGWERLQTECDVGFEWATTAAAAKGRSEVCFRDGPTTAAAAATDGTTDSGRGRVWVLWKDL
jgi:hypothetical protein